jgi:hypothetical protein
MLRRPKDNPQRPFVHKGWYDRKFVRGKGLGFGFWTLGFFWGLGFGIWSFVGLSHNSTGNSTGGSTGKNAKSLGFTEVLTGSRLQQGTRGVGAGWFKTIRANRVSSVVKKFILAFL